MIWAVVGGFVGVIAAILWLGLLVRSLFRHHDADLRAEVEKTNILISDLIHLQPGRKRV